MKPTTQSLQAVHAIETAKLLCITAGNPFQSLEEKAQLVDQVTGLPELLAILECLDGSSKGYVDACYHAKIYRAKFP